MELIGLKKIDSLAILVFRRQQCFQIWLTITEKGLEEVVRNAVATAQTNPGHFQRELNTVELESLARNLIEVSDPVSRGNFNTMFFQEVVNIVSTVMTDICNKYEEGT
ncbi:hypothetical protein POM88_053016 [Heracleum sosnowskyi]|uniref:Uncharacterized protein n=1 Tax=Heracleum sosnowskyi TaxID=360622 RepID=A0AAD8GQY3_9APIA|nr:hypothetical protein POM88_053016 [Heracleum sosnowskyi]